MEILNPFFQPAFTIVYHKGLLSFLSVDEGKVYRQHVDLRDTTYIGETSIRPSFISTMIFGSPPLSDGVVKEGWFNGRFYELKVLTDQGFIYKLKVDPKGLSIVSFETYVPPIPGEEGTEKSEMFVYAIENKFLSKGVSEGASIPSIIKGRYPGMEISLTYERVELLKIVEEEDFKLVLPDGVEVIYTDTFPL